MKKTGLNGVLKVFSVDCNAIDNNGVLDIRKYLIKETRYKIMLPFIKKVFIRLIATKVNASNPTKCVSLSNQKCTIQPSLINLHPNEYTQKLCHYPFAVNLDRYVGSCNTFDDLSYKACVPNKHKI